MTPANRQRMRASIQTPSRQQRGFYHLQKDFTKEWCRAEETKQDAPWLEDLKERSAYFKRQDFRVGRAIGTLPRG